MQNKVFSVLNYVGHKSKIIETINQHLPQTINGVFWDMFSGSGTYNTSCKTCLMKILSKRQKQS